MSAMTVHVCVALLCLLLLTYTSNAFAPTRPFAIRTRGFPRLWEYQEDYDPNPLPFSEYIMQGGVIEPSDNAALGEAMTEESDYHQPSSFVMQNGTKGPSENATLQEATLEESAKGGLERTSLTANEGDADVLAEETTPLVHDMTSVIQVKGIQVASEVNSTVTIAEEVELAETVLLGDDPVAVEDKQDTFENTSPVIAKGKVELANDAMPLPKSALVDTVTNVEVDSDQDLLASSAVAKGAPEDDPKLSFGSVPLEEESFPVVDAKATLGDNSFDSAREKGALEEALKRTSESNDDKEVETAPAAEMGDALKPKNNDVISSAIGTLENASESSVDSTRDDMESDPVIETKDTLEEDLLVETEPTVGMMPEDILDIPLKTKDGSDDVIAPAIGTLDDSTDFSFELEGDPVIETNDTLEEDLQIDSSYTVEAETEPIVNMMSSAILDILSKTKGKSHDVIAPAIGTLEDSPDFLFDSTRDELESDPVIETKGTVEEDLLIDSSHTAKAETEPIVDTMPKDILDIPLKTKDKSDDVIAPAIGTLDGDLLIDSSDMAEAETEPIVDIIPEDILDIPLKTKDGSDDVIAPTIGTLEDSSDFLFDSARGELESDPVIESKGALEENLFVDSSHMAEAETEPIADMMPEDILDIPTEKEATVLMDKVDTSESTMPVMVMENEVDTLIAAKESTVLKEEMGEQAGFFFATTFDESAVLRQIKARKEARKEWRAHKRNEELSLLEQLQTAKDELDELKRQSALDKKQLQAEARRREAEWRERLNDMIAKMEIAEHLYAQAQPKMQEMMESQFEYELEAKKWKDRYTRDLSLSTDRYELEVKFRRQEQIAARERLSKTQADYREIVRLAKEEGRQKTAELKLEMSYELEEKEMRLRANDIRLNQLRNALEASDLRIAELERERTSVRELAREVWFIVKGRLQKRSAMIIGRLQKLWMKRRVEETSDK